MHMVFSSCEVVLTMAFTYVGPSFFPFYLYATFLSILRKGINIKCSWSLYSFPELFSSDLHLTVSLTLHKTLGREDLSQICLASGDLCDLMVCTFECKSAKSNVRSLLSVFFTFLKNAAS